MATTRADVKAHEDAVGRVIADSIAALEYRLLELTEQHMETAALARRANAANARVCGAKAAVEQALGQLRAEAGEEGDV